MIGLGERSDIGALNDSFRLVARAASVLAILFGLTGVLGWVFDVAALKSLLPGLATMKMNTAVSFVLGGMSLMLQSWAPPGRRTGWLGRACAVLTIGIGTITLLQYALHIDAGIDQLLVRDEGLGAAHPGRMAPNTALSVALVGVSLLALDSIGPARRWAAQLSASLVLVLGFIAVTGYLLDTRALYGVAGYTSMAAHTALGLVVLSVGILAARPQRGLVAILAQDVPAGGAARRLVLLVALVPLALGWVVLQGQRAGYYAAEFGLGLMVTGCACIFAALVLWNGQAQGRAESARTQEAGRFRLFVAAVKDYAIFLLDPDGTVATWNAGAERLTGYRAEEILGKHASAFYVPEDVVAGKPQPELERAARDGSVELEGWRVRKDGSRLWAHVVTTALRNARGDLIGFGKVTHDMTERVRASEQFRLALEAAPTGMLLINQAGKIVLANLQVEKLFGYTRKELLGNSVELLIPERFRGGHPAQRTHFSREPEARSMGAGRELFGLRKDGTEVPVEIGLTPLKTDEGEFVLSSIVDIAERKRAEREREQLLGDLTALNLALEQRVAERTADLSATLREREVLLQEIHHRVKNNLYVVVSLMEMQARALPEGEGRLALEDCQGRVHAIALIHEKLYQSKNYADVPFAEYLRGLAGDVFRATGVSPSTVTLTFDLDDELAITVEQAIPCGLILNELITNALKHAFPGGRAGTIRVAFGRAAGERLRLTVADDGVGLPAGLDVQRAKSLGLRLVETLAKQLDGQLAVTCDVMTRFELTFPDGAADS